MLFKRKSIHKILIAISLLLAYHMILIFIANSFYGHDGNRKSLEEESRSISTVETCPIHSEVHTGDTTAKTDRLSLDAVYGTNVLTDHVPPVASVLDDELVPNIVFYVWCGIRRFEFANFLSVLSVIRTLQPDNILFYYDHMPELDNNLYHTWFDELKDLYPLLVTLEIDKDSALVACDGNYTNTHFLLHIMNKSGGIYVNEYAILDIFPIQLRKPVAQGTMSDDHASGLFVVLRGDDSANDQVICATKENFNRAESNLICVEMRKKIYPENFWFSHDNFSKLVRKIYYDNSDVIVPLRSNETLSPNIAHVVWMGGKEMDFKFYLCVLSLLRVAKMDTVYIHSDQQMHGEFWDRISHEENITLLYRHPLSRNVYGRNIKVIQHWADVLRLDILIKYGGLYMDVDALIVKPLTDSIRSYDAVLSLDFPGRPPWPNYINNGVMLGKKNAEFFRRFLATFKWLNEDSFHWNCVYQPYKVLERHPHLAHIDPHFQVMCAFEEGFCHPTWVKGFHFRHVHHISTNSLPDWKEDAYVYHITGTPPTLQSEESCIAATDMLGEICKYILTKAGRL